MSFKGETPLKVTNQILNRKYSSTKLVVTSHLLYGSQTKNILLLKNKILYLMTIPLYSYVLSVDKLFSCKQVR